MHVTVSSFGKNRSKALRWSAFAKNFMGVTTPVRTFSDGAMLNY
jgi:hypothetical protein